MEFVSGHPDIFVYLVLVVIEQALLLVPGSWPYRHGIPVRFKPLGLSLEETRNRLAVSTVRLHYDVDVTNKEISFRNAFPLWTWVPLFFTGRDQFDSRGRVIIRAAPLTSLGVIYLLLDAIETFQFQSLATALLMALVLAWYYRWLSVKLRVLL